MAAIHIRALIFFLLASAGAAAVAADGRSDADARAEAIRESVEQARAQLDEAARKLAKLHSEMWQLETNGPRSEKPMLGILLGDYGRGDGLTLAGVTPEGGAEQAGLKAGDRVVEVNGVRLDQGGDSKPSALLQEALADVSAGDTVAVVYERDGETREASIVTRPRGRYMAMVAEEKQPWLESLQALDELEHLEALKGLEELEILKDGRLDLEGTVTRVPAGLSLEDVSGELASYFDVDSGVLVLAAPDAADALQAGDILLNLAGEPVSGADDALTRLAGLKGTVAADVKRHGKTVAVELDADALNASQALHVVRGDRRIRIQQREAGDDVRLEITVDD